MNKHANREPARQSLYESSAVLTGETVSGFDVPTFPAFATIPNWSRLSGMGRTSTYEALSDGRLRAVKLGARTLIDVQHGLAWLRSLPLAIVHLSARAKS